MAGKVPPSMFEAIARGLRKGASWQADDKLGAGFQALLATLDGDAETAPGQVYRQSLSENRSDTDAAREAHPDAFFGSQVAGTIANPTNYIPGVGVANMGAFQGAMNAAGGSDDGPVGMTIDAVKGLGEGFLGGRLLSRFGPKPTVAHPGAEAGPMPAGPEWAEKTVFNPKSLLEAPPVVKPGAPGERVGDAMSRLNSVEDYLKREGPDAIAAVRRIIETRGPKAEPFRPPQGEGTPSPALGELPRQYPPSHPDAVWADWAPKPAPRRLDPGEATPALPRPRSLKELSQAIGGEAPPDNVVPFRAPEYKPPPQPPREYATPPPNVGRTAEANLRNTRMPAEEFVEEFPMLPRAKVESLANKHGADLNLLRKDLGDKDIYRAQDIFDWLGY
jgi:hypothetical protein